MKSVLTRVRSSKQLISALKRYRKLKRLTQNQLGQSAGLPQTTISKVEVELIDPTLTTLFRMLAALELELEIRPRKKESDEWLLEETKR
jgi:HTH-type transcriptional regulator / antitoxin HipB